MGETFDALRDAEALYAHYLEVNRPALLSLEPPALVEPARTVEYPMGFVLDERKVNAVVG